MSNDTNGLTASDIEKSNLLLRDHLLTKHKIRMCMINANSTSEDILNTIELLDKIANKLYKEILESKW